MNEMAPTFGNLSRAVSKIDKFKWTIKDYPGEIVYLNKNILQIHPAYQRNVIRSKVIEISSAWSWVACGAIIVGKRGGEYWVIDGQHRVVASRNRADIDVIPCVVFQTEDVEQEAKGFIDANTGRKAISNIDKFRAGIAANDHAAKYVDAVFSEIGITVTKGQARKPLQMKSVGIAVDMARENKDAFDAVIHLIAVICKESSISQILLGGLYYIYVNSENKFNDKRLVDRLKSIGGDRLEAAAKRAVAYHSKSGRKIWADGMIAEVNKGLRNQITVY